ncbi:DNA-dependent RNA polymerase, subunit E'' [Candidatus Haloredivivus sp. G17]|jgi:DNA-directed RNA polymerase subunit E"|nr:DNA-dependent RNA polymerase, subunit E'' [Candidatus Haloredivivus sp. G17]
MSEKACTDCKRIVEDSDECPVCKNNVLSDSWSGLVVIYDTDSEIAEEMGIQTPGRYAIRVK